MSSSRSRKQKRAAAAPGASAGKDPHADIPEDEQWRLIEQSGILKRLPRPEHANEPEQDEPQSHEDEEDDSVCSPLMEEIFNSILLVIPFTSLYIMMDILAHRQYARSMTSTEIMSSVLTNMPILSLFIFYTTRYKSNPRMQALLFLLSVGSGVRIIYVVNRASWKIVLRQCPPLGTVWVYTILQLRLSLAVVALGLVAAWTKVYGMKIIF